MTTLHEAGEKFKVAVDSKGDERREHRRHDMEAYGLTVDRWDGNRRTSKPFGQLVDLSAGGVRIRAKAGASIRPDSQIRVKLDLPPFAGICPFVDTSNGEPAPKREWIGWMTVARVMKRGSETEIAGRLVDMEEMDRGMLGLYLSTQPLAA